MRGLLGGWVAPAAMIAALMMLSACGDPASEPASDEANSSASPTASATTSSPMSTIPPPTQQSPMAPPSTPSDPQPVDQVAGQVVRGGAGPCYGIQTDDGKLYAVHSPTTGQLEVGTTVLVKLGPAVPRMDCGPGNLVSALRIDVVS